MGDAKKIRKSYSMPSHPWNKDRIESENKILSGYGLKTKKELLKLEADLKKYRRIARDLIGSSDESSEKKKTALLKKLANIGIIKDGSTLEDVLALKIEDFLERRFQTLVHKKGIANNIKHARQLIIHGHVAMRGEKHTSPSTLVPTNSEKDIKYVGPAIKIATQSRKRDGPSESEIRSEPGAPSKAPKAPEEVKAPEEAKEEPKAEVPEAPKEEAPAETPAEEVKNE